MTIQSIKKRSRRAPRKRSDSSCHLVQPSNHGCLGQMDAWDKWMPGTKRCKVIFLLLATAIIRSNMAQISTGMFRRISEEKNA
jgi:hypothetical protein